MKANSREEIRSLRTFQMLISLWKFLRLWSTLHFSNTKPLKIDWKIIFNKNCPTMVDNTGVETLPCAGIFRMLLPGHLFSVTLLYWAPNSDTGDLSDSGRERAGCGPWPFREEALLPYTSWKGDTSIIYRLCLLSFLWDKQASGKARIQMKEFFLKK